MKSTVAQKTISYTALILGIVGASLAIIRYLLPHEWHIGFTLQTYPTEQISRYTRYDRRTWAFL